LENQKALKEKTLLVRQDQFAFSQKKLDNSKDRLLDETNVIKYEMQQNNIALSEIAIEKLKNDRSKLKEKEIAPADGIISSVDVKEGAAVHNNTVIAYISDTSGVIGKLDVSEYDAPLIELNQRAELSTSGIPDKIYQGKVSFIWEAAVEKESSDDEIIVPIEIEIENIDDKLKIGYSVDIDIFVKEAVNVLMVPIQAVMQEEEGYFVYQLEDNIPVKKEVQVGLYGDKYVEIISGISEGAEIILRPSEVA
jgi:HlyD family secretion protein